MKDKRYEKLAGTTFDVQTYTITVKLPASFTDEQAEAFLESNLLAGIHEKVKAAVEAFNADPAAAANHATANWRASV